MLDLAKVNNYNCLAALYVCVMGQERANSRLLRHYVSFILCTLINICRSIRVKKENQVERIFFFQNWYV